MTFSWMEHTVGIIGDISFKGERLFYRLFLCTRLPRLNNTLPLPQLRGSGCCTTCRYTPRGVARFGKRRLLPPLVWVPDFEAAALLIPPAVHISDKHCWLCYGLNIVPSNIKGTAWSQAINILYSMSVSQSCLCWFLNLLAMYMYYWLIAK